MKRLSHAMLALMLASAVTSVTLLAQAKPAAQPPAKPAPAPATPPAPVKLSPPIKGEATIEVTPPATTREKNEAVTVMRVRNISAGSIAGLKIQEYWYDKAGQVVNGNDERLKTPLQPGAVHTFTLRTPYSANMQRNSYQFSHANGKIKTKPVPKIVEGT